MGSSTNHSYALGGHVGIESWCFSRCRFLRLFRPSTTHPVNHVSPGVGATVETPARVAAAAIICRCFGDCSYQRPAAPKGRIVHAPRSHCRKTAQADRTKTPTRCGSRALKRLNWKPNQQRGSVRAARCFLGGEKGFLAPCRMFVETAVANIARHTAEIPTSDRRGSAPAEPAIPKRCSGWSIGTPKAGGLQRISAQACSGPCH